MIVVNLFGGPGVGKSTTAAMLFAHYKRRGIRAELAREVAKDMLYQGVNLQRNQVLMLGRQYQTLKDLETAGTELAISDSPLRLQSVYARHSVSEHILFPFAALIRGMCQEFREVDVLLNRRVPYQTHGREQGEEAARKIDAELKGPFDAVIDSPAPQDVIALLDPVILPMLS